MNAVLLIIPILLPIAAGLLAKRTADKKWIIPVLILELVLVILARLSNGAVSIPCIYGTKIVLTLDGLGSLFSILFSGMFLLAGIFGFEYLHEKIEIYYVFYLCTLGAMVGLCFAGNLLTYYMFYEIMTLCSFPLILHEGTEKSRRAAMKYLGYSLFGAALALFGFFVVYPSTGGATFVPGGHLSGTAPKLILAAALAMIIGFGGKAGMIPLQDWLPTAHPEAPAPASAVLSGVITKSGVLGIIRVIYFLLGTEVLVHTFVQNVVLILALTTVFCGSMLAYKEKVLKKRLAYSTVSQVSYVIFGLMLFNSLGFSGAIMQAVFHAVSKVCLFLCAGAIICKTGKTRVEQMVGIGKVMPTTLVCFAFAGLSLVGIPPFSGFVSKWYLAEGSLTAYPALGWIGAAVLLVSALLTAGYLLGPVSKAFFYERDPEIPSEVHCGWYITLPLIVLALGVLLFGIFPSGVYQFASGLAAGLM